MLNDIRSLCIAARRAWASSQAEDDARCGEKEMPEIKTGPNILAEQIKTMRLAFPGKPGTMEFDDSPREVYASSDYVRDALLVKLGFRQHSTAADVERVAQQKASIKP